MIKKRLPTWLGLLALCCVSASFAADTAPLPAGSLIKRLTPEAMITAKLGQAFPQYPITSVRPSPIEGLYLVQIGGSDVLVTADGSKFIQGEIFNLTPGGISKWEDPAMVAERKKLLATVNPKDSINFKATGKTKAVVYVFTDVDCGYCRKLNSEMAEYNKLGIEIRYLAFPRAGIPSPSADKLITAWCSKDKQAVLTKVKEGHEVPNITCNNPVAAQFDLGGRIGVNATPALWMPNGEIKLGYLPPQQMAKALGIL
ncbi:MAG TPA: thioredoxin fold domain-containing protein [Cellvibrio sp.]|nr:thioredoxin fold domain-containing protein [Cellvibrio sp.]